MAEDPKGNSGEPSRTDGPEAQSGDRTGPERAPRERSDGAANRGADGPRPGDRGPRPGDRGPRPGDRSARPGGPRPGDRGPRSDGPRPGDRGPRPDSRGPRADGPRNDGPRNDGPRNDGPRRDDRGPRRDDRGPRRDDDRRNDAASPLTASLFSAVQDKQVPCRIAGCENTWTWFAAQQIRGFGQPPPDRMCDEHLGQFNELADREVPCRTPGCPNTWTWKRGAQLAEMQRTGKLRRPSRLCAECFTAERETHDAELPCKIDGCKRTWTWTRDAQLRHRLWVLRQRAKADAVAARGARSRDEQGEAREGEVREGEAPRTREGREGSPNRQGTQNRGEVREGEPRSRNRGEAREGEPRSRNRGEAREGEAREGEAREGEAREGEAREGEAPRTRERSRNRGPREPRELREADAPRLRAREATHEEPTGFDVTVERALPFLGVEPVAGSDVAVSGDLSSGTGPEGHVAQDSRDHSDHRDDAPSELSAPAEASEPANQAPESESESAESAESESESGESGPGGDRKKRRRKRRRGGKPAPNPEGPPERMCGLCAQKISRIQAKEQPCKVHGCSRTWTWDRASQMRAWVLSGSDDLDFEPAAPKRMCEVCREFCRTHPDREVPCGRPGCNNSWTFKTGAQLQAFLAGRTADPLKLCGECSKGEFAATFRPSGEAGAVPEGAETMPCVVPGCEGTWLYIPGMRLRDAAYGELSPDRMCDRHRVERGFGVAAPPEVQEVEVTAADLAVDEPVEDPAEDHHDHDLPVADEATPEVEDAGDPADTEEEHPEVSTGVPVEPDPGA